jgi:site-specific DNA recombinase
VPPIIDETTFRAAQQQLRRNQEQSPRNAQHTYLLSGRFRCRRCGRAMTGYAVRGARRYRCRSLSVVHDAEARCRGSMLAKTVEAQVWAAVVRVLEQPELIAEEVRTQEAHADVQRAEVQRDLDVIEAALAKCDKEAQRWADAYAAEVINLAELKGYRAEIDARRRGLQAQQAEAQAKLDAIGEAMGQVEALIDYCARVRERLQTFDDGEKRRAFEALDIRVSWTPGEPLTIHGSIPLSDIVPMPAEWY